MPTSEGEQPDFKQLIDQLFPDMPPQEILNLLLAAGRSAAPSWDQPRPMPTLLPIPDTTRGFRIRIDLQRTKPPVWRRIEVPGSILLPQLHLAIQTAMGWLDSHLHRFRTGNRGRAPEFITQFDLSEGEEGMLEDTVRLDQVVSKAGDKLWYDYDFGDGWDHVLLVEKVLDEPPAMPACVGGKRACPPEDCGGVWGYEGLAQWVRSGYDDDLRPEVFDSTEDALAWLPFGWHPDAFDIDEVNAEMTAELAEPIAVGGELAALLARERNAGGRELRKALAGPAAYGPVETSDEDAARITEPFRILLEVIGEGKELTGAGYLKPADVEQIAQRTGITKWWIGKANREDLTWPVAELRSTARALGLLSVRKGRISPTQATKRIADDPQALVQHIASRLPLGKVNYERDAGWLALATAGSEMPANEWKQMISSVMYDIGWRDGNDRTREPSAESPTLDVLDILRGKLRDPYRVQSFDPAVAALARAALRA